MNTEFSADRRLSLAFPLAVFCAAVVLYLNILPNTFILDDWPQILENPFLRVPGGLGKIFTTNVWGFQGKAAVSNFYRPLMHATFYFTYRLFGAAPAAYHALSILLHALVSLMVYALVTRLAQNRYTGLAAGLLFAAHPIHTENVCWISGYPDLQAALFVLLGWWLYGVQSPKSKVQSRIRSLALALCFFLGLLAKEITVVLPVMLLAQEFLGNRARPAQVLNERWPEYLGMGLAAGAYAALRYHALGGLMPQAQGEVLPGSIRFFTALALFYRYWAKLLWPAELNFFPYFPASQSFFEWPVPAGLGALVLFLWAFYRLARRGRPEALGLLLFALALAPAFTMPYAYMGWFMAERYLYLPSVGFCWLAAWLGVRAVERGWRLAPLAALVLFAYSARTVARNLDWRSETAFLEDAARLSPAFPEVHFQLGEAYLRHGRLREAAAATERAAAMLHHSVEAHYNLGWIYSRLGQPQRAVEEFRRAAEYALEYGRTSDAARARNNLGLLLLATGKLGEAEHEFERALEADPAMATAHSNLGLVHLRRGRLDRAEAELAEALRREPRQPETYVRLGDVAVARGDRARAEEFFRQALRLNPHYARAQAALAKLQRSSEGK